MKKILLVEDDVFLQQLYKDVLIQAGYDVEAVDDGNIALEKIKLDSWNLILLDVMLPHMDGFTILNSIKKNQIHLSCPVVFMTNLDGNEDDKAKLKAADEYWIKSDMSPPEFIANVKKILQG